MAQLNGGQPDLIFMVIADSEPREFRYRVLRDVSSNGIGTPYPSPATTPHGYTSSRLGDDADGADAAVAQLDSDPRPELVLLHEDVGNGAPDNDFRFKILWNLDEEGQANTFLNPPTIGANVPGLGHDSYDSGFAIANLGGSRKLEVIYLAYDVGAANSAFRFRVETDAVGVTDRFGAGCAGALGVPTLEVRGQIPARDRGLDLYAGFLSPTAHAILFVDTVRLAPPLDLAPLGSPGCFLHVVPRVQLGFSNGWLTRIASLPPLAQPNLTLTAQGVFLDSGQFFVSNPIELTFGRLLP